MLVVIVRIAVVVVVYGGKSSGSVAVMFGCSYIVERYIVCLCVVRITKRVHVL